MFQLHNYEYVEVSNHFFDSQNSFYATEVKGDKVCFVTQEDQGLEGPSQGVVQGQLSEICNSVSVGFSYT